MPIVYVLVLLFIQGVYPQCQPLLYRTNITADNFRIADKGLPLNTFTYTFKSSFSSVPQTAFSVTGLATRNNNSLMNSNFRIFGQNTTRNSLQILYISTGSLWVIGSICLWASTNTQLWIGSSLIQNMRPFTDSSLKRLSFQISNPNLIPVKGNQITRCFINGFNGQGVFESLSFVNSTVVIGGITIQLEVKAQNISMVWFSIINFGMNNGQFDAYGGVQLITAGNEGSINILNSFSSTENSFFGLSGLNTAPTSGFLFNSQINSNFMLDYKANKGNYIISYLFIGYPSRFVCSKCTNSQNIFNNGLCFSYCPANSILTTLSDGGKMCRYCIKGMIIEKDRCICPSGTTLSNGICVIIGINGLIVQSSNPLSSQTKNIYTPQTGSQGTVYIPEGAINQYFDFSSLGSSSQSNANSASLNIGTTSSTVSSSSILSINQASTIFLPQAPSQAPQSSQSYTSGAIFVPSTSANGYPQVLNPSYQSASSTNVLAVPPTTKSIIYSSSASSNPSNTQSSITSSTSQGNSSPSSNWVNGISSTDCLIQNSFYNGNQCVCIVSFVFINGKCVSALNAPSITIPPINNPTNIQDSTQITCQKFAYYNGTACVCYSNYYIQDGSCLLCPPTTIGDGFTCSCPQPLILINNKCVSNSPSACPQNSKDNGIGVCICHPGFQMSNNVCVVQCPPSQTLLNGTCSCLSGFRSVNGMCQRCPAGSLWSSVSQKCIFVCGLNARYNQSKKQCECVQGFGKDATGTCQICGGNYYLFGGYCVSCPINSFFNSSSSTCICNVGFITAQQGICVRKCQENEDYNTISTFCECKANLTRVGTECVICSGYTKFGQCLTCPDNSVFIKDTCICNQGYISDSTGKCVVCSALSDTFLLNNRCVVCPNTKIYNSSLGVCVCPPGKDESGSSCVARCQSNQLLDRNGNCYSCGQNMVISNGSCVCAKGYIPDGCGGCKINCKSGQFQFLGLCAICPMSTIYMKDIKGCVCPNGYYLDGKTNSCQKSPFVTPDCSTGTFYDVTNSKCSSCPSSCISCLSINECLGCRQGYDLQQGACRSICGDGLIRDRQSCDSGAAYNPGCINCAISSGYSCLGQPSICTIVTVNPPPPIPDPSIPSLTQKGNFTMNTNNVFVVLQTNPTFTFPNSVEMQNFIKANFTNSFRPTYYCNQQLPPNLDLFNCILIYPSGIPNSRFTVIFSYNYGGKMANTSMLIDPIAYAATRRRTNT